MNNRDLIDQWRAAADRHDSAAVAAVYRLCADQLEQAADDRHPLGYVKVGTITGIAERVDILMSGEGLYGLDAFRSCQGKAAS